MKVNTLKHGFMIMAHTDFDFLLRMVKILAAPNHHFFIHIDRKVDTSMWRGELDAIKNITNCHVYSGDSALLVNHGGYSQVECELFLLHRAHAEGMDYYHLLSGQDFPTQSNVKFDTYFESHCGESFMTFDTDEEHEIWKHKKYQDRFRRYCFTDITHRGSLLVKIACRAFGIINNMVMLRPQIPNIRAGWNWFTWHNTVVEYVLRAECEQPIFFNRFHMTSCCDELIFHTLLFPHIDELHIHRRNSLRYINWEKQDSSRIRPGGPLILNMDEYDDIRSSGAFFCRKVNPKISIKLIERLEEDIKRQP